MPDANEAKRIWSQILSLEATQPGQGEDKKAFFSSKAKEMAKLRSAYDKATGLDSSNPATQQAIQTKATIDAIVGNTNVGPATTDNLG